MSVGKLDNVNVVVGIISKGDKFLVERRKADEPVDPSIVCLPGGHVNMNETLEEALKREMLEELDIEIEESRFLCKNYYVASNGERQEAYCFEIIKYIGEPTCKSALEIFWEDNIDNLDLEVDRETIKKLRKNMR